MKALERVHQGVTHLWFRFDEFEVAIFDAFSAALTPERREIFNSQLSLINKSQYDYDEERGVKFAYFYWMYFGKSRRDFPKRFAFSSAEELLGSLEVRVNSEWTIFVRLNMVKGVFFWLEYKSTNEYFRPLTPNFQIVNVVVGG